MNEYQTWREYLIEKLTADHKRAVDYLDVALEEYQVDGDAHLFLVALRTVIESQDGIAAIAKLNSIDPQTLLEILSSERIPDIDMLSTLLTTLGCRLSIEPLQNVIHVLDKEYSIAPGISADPNVKVAT